MIVHPAHHEEESPDHHPDVNVKQPQQEHNHVVSKEDDLALAEYEVKNTSLKLTIFT